VGETENTEMAMTRSAASTAAASLLLVLGACGKGRTVEQEQVQQCVRCHGGTDSTKGPSLPGAHISHLSAPHGVSGPVACETCHVVPSTVSSEPSHMDGTVEVSFNAFARNGVAQAAWDRTGQTCNVYCHGATLSGGSAKTPVWTDLDGSERQCGSCHGAPPPRPHPQRDDCATCHPATVGASGIISGGAHLDGDVDVDYAAMGCTDCHGDAQRPGSDLLKVAPPIGTHAETATNTLAVGAHQAHLAKASLAQSIACGECHVVPTTPAHSNDQVDIAFGILATRGGLTPAWDRGAATCSSTYCHGATIAGGTNKAPVWTGGASQAACGTCHGAPPPPPHPSGTQCHTCHPSTVNEDGSLNVAGGAHVDGSIEVESFHPPGWASPTVHGYAANRDLASCKACHGDDLAGGGIGVSCDTCHNAVPGIVNWRTTCTFCHGDVQRADAIEAAPPVGTEGELGTLERAVGAHQQHLVDGDIRQAIACTECHAVPADISQPQHVNGGVNLSWGPLATASGAAASFDTVNVTCANYCHGETLHGGTAKTPIWTKVDGTQDDCDDCHGSPPPTKADGSPHPQLTLCRACHPLTVAADAHPAHTIDVAGGKHIDGQVQATSYHPAGWADPTAHGYAANRDFASCKACHGADFAGGDVGVSCNACHASNGHASWQTECTFCHGDPQRAANKPAPPVGTEGETLTSDRAVGAHQKHLAGPLGKPIACTECHVIPGDISHLNGTAALAWGPLATARSATASFNASDLSCANYCHGATLGGGARTNPVWTGASQATCGSCHGLPPPAPHPVVAGGLTACRACHLDTVDASGAIIPASAGGRHLDGLTQARGHDESWMDTTSAGFHAFSANAGLGTCQACHGVNLDGPSPQGACASCHTQGGPASDLAACTGCHGGNDNSTGAPPRTTWGNGADLVRTGAHTAHVTTDIALAIGCAVCHQTPANMFAVGHVDPSPAEVVFSGIALGAAPWNRSAPSCAVYCHGATLSGGSNTSPLWTGGSGQATCGSCHGLPPATLRSGSPHPAASSDPRICSACHPQTVDANGVIIPASAGGLHLDGAAQAVFGHDPTTWSNPLSPGFHAYSANQGLSNCQVCHGPLLDGGVAAVGCQSCHRAAGPAPELTCTGCHGGTDNSTGAPPRAQWAFRSDAAEASLRAGAHTTHLSLSAIAPTIGCSVCHATPADMFASGHIDQATTANVAFTGLAAIGITPAPTWDRSAPTCAVYCHGATLHGGSLTTPIWTAVGQGQAACGTCHGIPPTNPPHPTVSASLVGCHDCHPETIDAAGAMILPLSGGKHLNGLIDGGHTPSWITPASVTNLEFHAYSANRGLANCRICHGPLLDGVGGSTTVGCQSCHNATGPAPELTCTGCHGGTDNQTGAPPRATWGNTNAVAIGAHSSHVGTNPVSGPMACSECHVEPSNMFSPGHIDDAVTVAFQGAVSGLKPATWNYPATGTPTCSSTYCHGNFTNGTATNTPSWTGANQAACGSCHNARPQGSLHRRHERQEYTIPPWWPQPGQSGWVTCDQCHSGIAASVNNLLAPTLTQVNGGGPPLHVNGTPNVVFKLGGSFDPSTRTCSSMACHPGEIKNW
jgi:predicted CxxxxCH...CXXCH cytochrome family protein